MLFLSNNGDRRRLTNRHGFHSFISTAISSENIMRIHFPNPTWFNCDGSIFICLSILSFGWMNWLDRWPDLGRESRPPRIFHGAVSWVSAVPVGDSGLRLRSYVSFLITLTPTHELLCSVDYQLSLAALVLTIRTTNSQLDSAASTSSRILSRDLSTFCGALTTTEFVLMTPPLRVINHPE